MRLWTAPATARASRPGRLPPPPSRAGAGSSSRALPLVEWPFSDPLAAVVSLMDLMLCGFARPARSPQGVRAGEEPPDQAVGLIRALDLRHVAAALEHDLLGARKRLRDVALEARRDQPVMRAPDEERGPLEVGETAVEAVLAERLVEVVVAGRAEEGEARARRRIGPLELVDHDVVDVRVDRVGVVEEAHQRRRHAVAPEGVGQEAELGAREADDRVVPAPDERDGGAQECQRADALGLAQGDL